MRHHQMARIGGGVALSLALGLLGTSAPAEEVSALRVGAAEPARWTETTVNAAKSPDQQAVLQRGHATTVTGEIVDTSCYLQLNKRGAAHVACGAACVRHGQPIGLVDGRGQLYLVVPEEHDPRKGGLVSIREYFADHMGQTATVTGMLIERQGYRTVFVAGAPLTPASTTPATPSGETR